MFVEYKEIFKGLTASSGVPYLNESYPSLNMGAITKQPYDYQKIVNYIKKSPEALGIFNTIITDIVSDGVYFMPHITRKDTNRDKKAKLRNADDFWRDQQMKKTLKDAMLDWLMLGNSAIWIGLTKEQLKECYYEARLEFKEDEALNPKRKFRHVAWSTMRINHDNKNIIGYSQIAGSGGPIVDSSGRPIPGKFQAGGFVLNEWKPEQIIHATFMGMNGKVYGYTPTISIMPEISTLQLIKDYAGNFFQNSGIPDWMFILPKEMAGSPNVIELEQKLRIWQNSVDKHRNLVFAGDVTPHKLNEFRKDMEFRQLAVYYSAILAFAFGLPLGKMQSILGMEMRLKESDMANESYWRNISEAQDYWEQLLNSQFWIPYFDVEMNFKRSYLQDEIRESQNFMFLSDYLAKLRAIGYKPTEDYVKRILKLKDGDIEKVDENEGFINFSGNRQNFLSNQQTMGNANLSQQKKKEQQGVAEKSKIRQDLK